MRGFLIHTGKAATKNQKTRSVIYGMWNRGSTKITVRPCLFTLLAMEDVSTACCKIVVISGMEYEWY